MKKFINFLLGLLLFNAILALGLIISFKAVLSKDNISKIIYTLLETNESSLDSIAHNTDGHLSKYVDKTKLSKAMGEYINQTILYNTEVSKTPPNRSIVIEEIRESIKKYNKDNKDQISEDVADNYVEELKEFEEESFKDKKVLILFKTIYSKKIFGIIIAIIIICASLIMLNSDLNKVFFHLGLTTIMSSTILFIILLIANSLINDSTGAEDLIPIVKITISKLRNIGIYGLLIGIVSMTLYKIIPKRELEEKK